MDDFERAVSMAELCKAAKECRKGVSNKAGPVEFNLHRLSSCKRLKDDIVSGKYKMRPGTRVIVYRPKYRVATAPWFRDRVWQRSMCNNGVYEDLTQGFLTYNVACQKGKGTDMAISRVIKMLQRLHRTNPGAKIYGAHLDIKGFFPSTPQGEVKAMDDERISDERFLPFIYEIIDSIKDERRLLEIESDPFGERGTGLGSQINQLNQIALLDPIDHEVIIHCKNYIRYNDDMLVLSHDKKDIEKVRLIIKNHLEGLGLIMTDKAGIFTVDKGFYFLRKKFIMKESGKIIIRLHKKALSEERKTLRGLKRCVDCGLRTMEDVKNHYQSWVANAEYAGDAPIKAMDRFYSELFRQRPVYKRKKRYLYGSCINRKRTIEKSRTGEQKTQTRIG